jgi:uncharacterized protein (TIGR03083 family)
VHKDEVWRTIYAERSALADVLEILSPTEWEQPSLCPGWTVKDVAAHVVSSAGATFGEVVSGMVKARGNFNRMMFQDAKRRSARPPEQIIADYRRLDGSRRHPPGTSALDPLMDVIVHTQDIVRPLGRQRHMPAAASAAAADRVWATSFPFHARKRLAGVRLTATDITWTVGDGPAIEGTMGAVLLLITGRAASLPELTGAGVSLLPSSR